MIAAKAASRGRRFVKTSGLDTLVVRVGLPKLSMAGYIDVHQWAESGFDAELFLVCRFFLNRLDL
jgi:hypothetical protein